MVEELDWKRKIKTLFPFLKENDVREREREGGKSIKRFSRINRPGLILEKNDPLSWHGESIIRTDWLAKLSNYIKQTAPLHVEDRSGPRSC